MLLDNTADFIERGIDWLSWTIHRIGGFILAAMMFLTATDVFLRYIFNRPISGALELNENMLVIVFFFSIRSSLNPNTAVSPAGPFGTKLKRDNPADSLLLSASSLESFLSLTSMFPVIWAIDKL